MPMYLAQQSDAQRRPLINRLDRLRIRHLRLLESIAQTGSLSAASQLMNMSQPGATKMLQELEAAFGCSLIERGKRGAQLSTAGAYALNRLRIALGALDAAVMAAGSDPQLPLVRLGVVAVVAVGALPVAIGALDAAQLLPRMSILEGTVERLMQLLLDNELDCIISRLEAGVQSLNTLCVTQLWEDCLACAAAPDHPLVRHRRLPAELLNQARWALPPRGATTRTQFEQWFLEAGAAPPVPHIESPSVHTTLALAATGSMLAVAARSVIRQHAARGVLRELRLNRPMPHGHLFFVAREEVADLPEVDSLRQALLRVANTTSP